MPEGVSIKAATFVVGARARGDDRAAIIPRGESLAIVLVDGAGATARGSLAADTTRILDVAIEPGVATFGQVVELQRTGLVAGMNGVTVTVHEVR